MASSNFPAVDQSSIRSLTGFMSTAKEKWNASGANEAMSKITASIPDSTREYVTQATGQIFSRERLRTVSLFFGIGEERPFYVEKNPSLLVARIKHNLQFFYLNYLLIAAIFFVLTLFVSPSAIIGMALLGGAWAYVIKSTQSGSMKVGSVTVSQKQATVVMGVISCFVMIWILSGVFWWAAFLAGLVTLAHGSFRDASMHQDGEDQVTMMGEVAPTSAAADAEQASFLGDPQV